MKNLVKIDNESVQIAEQISERFSGLTSVLEARNAESQTLKRVARNSSNIEAESIIIKLILFGLKNLNIKGKMSEFQIRHAAEIVFNEYGHYKVSEIQFVISRGMRGKYGKLYDKIDIADIEAWFEKYDSEKMDSCYMQKSQANTKRILETDYDDPKYIKRPGSIGNIYNQTKKQK